MTVITDSIDSRFNFHFMAYLIVLLDKKKTKGKREYNSCNILY